MGCVQCGTWVVYGVAAVYDQTAVMCLVGHIAAMRVCSELGQGWRAGARGECGVLYILCRVYAGWGWRWFLLDFAIHTPQTGQSTRCGGQNFKCLRRIGLGHKMRKLQKFFVGGVWGVWWCKWLLLLSLWFSVLCLTFANCPKGIGCERHKQGKRQCKRAS